PPAVVIDVLHGQRPGAPLLHRAVFTAWLRELHARRCNAGEPADDLEWPGLPDIPPLAPERQAAGVVCWLRTSLEPVIDQSKLPDATARQAAPAIVSAIIPCLDEE